MAIHANLGMHHNLSTGGIGSHKNPLNTLLEKVASMIEGMKQSQRAAREFDELNKLSNSELKDIGICRGDIGNIVARKNAV